MNDRLNAPVEPHDDGTLQDDPLYQEPSEGIATDSGRANAALPGDEGPAARGSTP
jgi:hypothetical protein